VCCLGITSLEGAMLNFTSWQKKTPVGWEEVLFTSKAVRFTAFAIYKVPEY